MLFFVCFTKTSLLGTGSSLVTLNLEKHLSAQPVTSRVTPNRTQSKESRGRKATGCQDSTLKQYNILNVIKGYLNQLLKNDI